METAPVRHEDIKQKPAWDDGFKWLKEMYDPEKGEIQPKSALLSETKIPERNTENVIDKTGFHSFADLAKSEIFKWWRESPELLKRYYDFNSGLRGLINSLGELKQGLEDENTEATLHPYAFLERMAQIELAASNLKNIHDPERQKPPRKSEGGSPFRSRDFKLQINREPLSEEIKNTPLITLQIDRDITSYPDLFDKEWWVVTKVAPGMDAKTGEWLETQDRKKLQHYEAVIKIFELSFEVPLKEEEIAVPRPTLKYTKERVTDVSAHTFSLEGVRLYDGTTLEEVGTAEEVLEYLEKDELGNITVSQDLFTKLKDKHPNVKRLLVKTGYAYAGPPLVDGPAQHDLKNQLKTVRIPDGLKQVIENLKQAYKQGKNTVTLPDRDGKPFEYELGEDALPTDYIRILDVYLSQIHFEYTETEAPEIEGLTDIESVMWSGKTSCDGSNAVANLAVQDILGIENTSIARFIVLKPHDTGSDIFSTRYTFIGTAGSLHASQLYKHVYEDGNGNKKTEIYVCDGTPVDLKTKEEDLVVVGNLKEAQAAFDTLQATSAFERSVKENARTEFVLKSSWVRQDQEQWYQKAGLSKNGGVNPPGRTSYTGLHSLLSQSPTDANGGIHTYFRKLDASKSLLQFLAYEYFKNKSTDPDQLEDIFLLLEYYPTDFLSVGEHTKFYSGTDLYDNSVNLTIEDSIQEDIYDLGKDRVRTVDTEKNLETIALQAEKASTQNREQLNLLMVRWDEHKKEAQQKLMNAIATSLQINVDEAWISKLPFMLLLPAPIHFYQEVGQRSTREDTLGHIVFDEDKIKNAERSWRKETDAVIKHYQEVLLKMPKEGKNTNGTEKPVSSTYLWKRLLEEQSQEKIFWELNAGYGEYVSNKLKISRVSSPQAQKRRSSKWTI